VAVPHHSQSSYDSGWVSIETNGRELRDCQGDVDGIAWRELSHPLRKVVMGKGYGTLLRRMDSDQIEFCFVFTQPLDRFFQSRIRIYQTDGLGTAYEFHILQPTIQDFRRLILLTRKHVDCDGGR